MKKEEIKRRIYKLRKERQLLEVHCLTMGGQVPLWLSIRYTKCWKKGCKCMKGQPHGPFSYVSFKQAGRLCYRYFPHKKTYKIRQFLNNYHSFQEKIARLNKIHQEITFLLKENQRNNLLPIPKWIREKKRKVSGDITKKITR